LLYPEGSALKSTRLQGVATLHIGQKATLTQELPKASVSRLLRQPLGAAAARDRYHIPPFLRLAGPELEGETEFRSKPERGLLSCQIEAASEYFHCVCRGSAPVWYKW
jgi:hypothetical protein